MREDKEGSTDNKVEKKKKKYVYLEKFQTYTHITEQRLGHLENMNLIHWGIEILMCIGLICAIVS